MPPRSLNYIFAAAAVAAQALAPGAWAADPVNVYLDQAKILHLPDKTATVIIGNPLVVEVTMLRGNGKIILTGKGFGETNLIALDRNGEQLVETTVKVASSNKNLILQRGVDRESYHCDPRCQPTVALGDATKFMGDTAGQISFRNSAESGAQR